MAVDQNLLDGFLLASDADRIIEEAAHSTVGKPDKRRRCSTWA